MEEQPVSEAGKADFSYLLVSLLLMLLIFPLLEGLGGGGLIFGLFYSVTLLSAVKAVSRQRRHFNLALLLALPAIACRWIGLGLESPPFLALGNVLSALFLSLTAALLLTHVLEAKRVTTQKIYGALCAYLLIGIVWALLYFVVEFFFPASFQPPMVGETRFSRMIYYSFVTLTTLGYGDVTPVAPLARSLSALEALMGQLFLAVLVARLVSLHVIHSQKDGDL